MSEKNEFFVQQFHQNIWIAQFDVNYYKIVSSIQSEKFEFLKYGKIYEFGEETDGDEVLKKKEEYFPFTLELERVNRFAHHSKITPDKLWIENSQTKLPDDLDYIFKVMSGGIVFNQLCADILKQHRFGENILTPVQIYDLSTGKLVSDEVFYFLNLYERRNYINYPQSDSIFVYIQGAKRYSTRGIPINDGILEVSNSALNCDIDLWHDDRLGGHFFMSDSLYQSLNQAGMIDKFNPHTCKLI